MKRFLYRCVLALGLALGPAVIAGAAPASLPPLSFGVVPQQAARKLAERWAPLLAAVSAQVGRQIRFTTAPDIPTFERRLARGEYDFAYMNPYHYTVFHRSPGYRAFAKEAETALSGIAVVREDSPATDIHWLAGRELAFPAPAAFAATVIPRSHLDRMGIPYTPVFVSSHDSVYLGVARGLYPAGFGVERTFRNLRPEVRSQLRILWRTPDYPPHAIAAHPRVPAALVRRVLAAMTALSSDAAGRALLQKLSFKGIEPARDSDWDPVRGLDIHLLDHLINRG